jgi:hypothetical protein
MDQQTAQGGTEPNRRVLAKVSGVEINQKPMEQVDLFAIESRAKAAEAEAQAEAAWQRDELARTELAQAERALAPLQEDYRKAAEVANDLDEQTTTLERQVMSLRVNVAETIQTMRDLSIPNIVVVAGELHSAVKQQLSLAHASRETANQAQVESERLYVEVGVMEEQVVALRVQAVEASESLRQAERAELAAQRVAEYAEAQLEEAKLGAEIAALMVKAADAQKRSGEAKSAAIVAHIDIGMPDDLLTTVYNIISTLPAQKRPWWQFLVTWVLLLVRGWRRSRAAGQASKEFRATIKADLASLPSEQAKVALLRGYQRKLQGKVEEEDQLWYDRVHTPGRAHVMYETGKAMRVVLTLVLTTLAVGLLIVSPMGGRGVPGVIWGWYQGHQPAAWAGFIEVCLGIVLAGFLRQWLKPDACLRADRKQGHKGWDIFYHHFLGYLPLGGVVAVAIDVGLGAVVATWLLGVVYPHAGVDNTTTAAVFAMLQFPFGGIFYIVRVVALFGSESRTVMDLKWVEGKMAGIGKKRSWWGYVLGGTAILATLWLLGWGLTQYVSTLVDFLSLRLGYVHHATPEIVLFIGTRTDTASVGLGLVFAIVSSMALGILQEGFPGSFRSVSSLCFLALGSTAAGLPGSLAPGAGIWAVGKWGREMSKAESISLETVYQQAAGTLLGLLTVMYQLLFLGVVKGLLTRMLKIFKK